MNVARYNLAGCGSTSTAFCFGGWAGGASAIVEKWNGAVWSTIVSMNQTRSGSAGSNTGSVVLVFGGYGSGYAVTEKLCEESIYTFTDNTTAFSIPF